MASTPISELPKLPAEIAKEVVEGADKLKHCETVEKNPLPSKEDLAAERTHADLIAAVEAGAQLKKAETTEKNVLPSKEDIAREKTIEEAAHFDASKLKKTETHVTTGVAVVDEGTA